MGLTGAHVSAHAARPRGILFLAGPTGVGKTELAKAVTQLVFGDERAYTRFDMSEFSAEHSDARLIGAPPGYVGHDAGGELTNAVRQRPFSLILFDEIEKAHPRILDKFLQILEDGRLTDGTGNTVHFSESLLVFTSNLGIYVDDADGNRVRNVEPDTPRSELESRIRAAISHHFQVVLNRPELLNRIGDNIIVFDFISTPVAHQLVDLFLDNICQRVEKEQRLTLRITDQARRQLHEVATADPSFGGRGIGSSLESVFVNPLARALFATDHPANGVVDVTDVRCVGDTWEVVILP
jgi:ATP-dependent Clp protease ATP-binding subunit ClpA